MTWKTKTVDAAVVQEWREAVTTCIEAGTPFDLGHVGAAWWHALAQQAGFAGFPTSTGVPSSTSCENR